MSAKQEQLLRIIKSFKDLLSETYTPIPYDLSDTIFDVEKFIKDTKPTNL